MTVHVSQQQVVEYAKEGGRGDRWASDAAAANFNLCCSGASLSPLDPIQVEVVTFDRGRHRTHEGPRVPPSAALLAQVEVGVVDFSAA